MIHLMGAMLGSHTDDDELHDNNNNNNNNKSNEKDDDKKRSRDKNKDDKLKFDQPMEGKALEKYVRNLRSSSLHQVPIPDGLDSMTYGALFTYFIRENIVPLGILRGVSRSNKVKGNKMEYVVANPGKDTELDMSDKVFILSAKAPRPRKDGRRDIVAEMRRNESNRRLANHHFSVDDVDASVKMLKSKHTELLATVNNMEDSLKSRITTIKTALQHS